MVEADFKWESVSKSISLKPGPKQYGFYKRGGKERFRNYHRELKNGKGLSLVDIIDHRLKEAQRAIRIMLMEKCWELF
jgi:hypothetical protein